MHPESALVEASNSPGNAANKRSAPRADPVKPVLAVQNLSIGFKGINSNLVDGVSFSVAPGETLCLVGESGCGKSITALSLMGLLPSPPAEITSGRAAFDGKDLLSLPKSEISEIRGDRIAMVFQEPMTSLNPVYTVGEQISEAVRRHRKVTKAEALDRALEMLKRVRIPAPEKRLKEYPHQLSGGMRQRVMIAMALANDPSLLIADEPTTALDVTIQAQILKLINSLQKETGTALIMITHDLGVVAEVADKVAIMYAGRIVEAGPVGEIFENPQHPYTLGLMSSMPSLAKRSGRLVTVAGMVPPADAMPNGCRFATRCPFYTPDCSRNVPHLSQLSEDHAVACFRVPLEENIGEAAS
ncbi:ABC transporter ATP-binding protein [Denitrobaculum tricleocarpae]|uniref:ABC transporter ATP-binding protein n=1 Tax=Denitrobaculum tricleocarpae TaxID=2591009 RepID=A0A545TXA4_9PROT|nr:ABC transporter ATP-binding protein [Denitrobaculum tricleocarpae]TQV81858.1 ABC transporter ATP-binding protein [Denitrobaculum tricleocarpae]